VRLSRTRPHPSERPAVAKAAEPEPELEPVETAELGAPEPEAAIGEPEPEAPVIEEPEPEPEVPVIEEPEPEPEASAPAELAPAELEMPPPAMLLAAFQQPGIGIGDEHYLGFGDANTDGSVRLLTVPDQDGDGIPDAKLQHRYDGQWLDRTLVSPVAGTGAADAIARAAAAAAQATANAALPNTGAALAATLADPTAAAALAALERARGFASVTDYGAKCDATVLTGVSMSASSTTLTIAGGHGLTSADIGRSVFVPLTGAARDKVYGASYLSASTATLERAAINTVSGVDGAVMQTVWNSSTGSWNTILPASQKRTATLSITAGSAVLTDSSAPLTAGARIAYFVRGSHAETLVATISAVPSSTTLTLSVAATVAVSGGTALVATDDTVAIQAAITALQGTGKRLVIPASCLCGPLSITGSLHLLGGPDALVYPKLDGTTASIEKLLGITGNRVTVEGVGFDGAYCPVLIASNKYIIHSTGLRTRVLGCEFTNLLSMDGNPVGGVTNINSGAANLLVVHDIYLSGAINFRVRDCYFNENSGAHVFMANASKGHITHNYFGESRWYAVHLDIGCDKVEIADNVFEAVHPVSRHWGGAIDLMSNTTGARNKRITVARNDISGNCDYGTPLRVLSSEDCAIEGNRIHDLLAGAYTGGPIQSIGLSTRASTGAGDNGPCKRVAIRRNTLTANGQNMAGIYCTNGEDPSNPRVARAAAEDIWIEDNILTSPDTSNYFDMGIALNGQNGGYDRARIRNNRVTTLTRDTAVLSGAPAFLTGAIALIGTIDQGAVDLPWIEGNSVQDIGTPNAGIAAASSRQIGLNIFQKVTNIRLGKNRWINYRLGAQTLSTSGGPVTGLNKVTQEFVSCSTDVLLTGGPWDTVPSAVAVALANTHVGKTIRFTAGGLTQAPPAVGVLGDAGWVGLWNSSAASITVSMAGGDQALAAGQMALLMELNASIVYVAGNVAT
jgi:hypothetical protein